MKNFLIVVGIVIVTFICFSACDDGGIIDQSITIEQYKQNVINDFNQKLTKSDDNLRRRVENAHGTVTVKKAYVSTCDVVMRDSSMKVKKNESNVAEVSLVITFCWDGVFHKNGYTKLRLVLDNAGKEWVLRSAKIIDTDAIINMEDPEFWMGVGLLILCA